MRVLALDLGSARIGVAVSDPRQVLASPVTVLARRDRAADHRAIAELVEEYEAGLVLVGLPRSLDGSLGRAAQLVLTEVDELRAELAVIVDTHDERFTTTTAHRNLAASGLDARARRRVVDQEAATVLLQSWLDGHHHATNIPEEQ